MGTKASDPVRVLVRVRIDGSDAEVVAQVRMERADEMNDERTALHTQFYKVQ